MATWLDKQKDKARREKLSREMAHQVQNVPTRIPDMFGTALNRLASGQALLTGKPIVEGLREQMRADPVQTAMDWAAPGVGGFIGSVGGKGQAALTELSKTLSGKGVTLDAYLSNSGNINIPRIAVNPELRGQGVGTRAMQDLLDIANREGRTVTLSPATDFGATSKKRLTDWYKRLGFVENKGRNKDFAISDTMYKLPDVQK